MADCGSCRDSWNKPDKSIKLVVKKRLPRQTSKFGNVLKPRSLNAAEENRNKLKRQNPFSCSPRKKANIARPSKDQENVKLFSDLDKLNCPVNNIDVESSNVGDYQEALPTLFEFQKQPQAATSTLSNNKVEKALPLDWSLKTRIRFTSSEPFSWCSKLLSNQEAKGICKYVQQQDTSITESGQECVNFQQNIMYWSHPVLPWLNLFPRLSSEIKLTSKVPHIGENVEMAEAMQASWAQSFRSLFNLLRCGQCDYFYLCSSQTTMLFRAANIGGLSTPSVLITPTTKGMREAFDKEGIAYTLPILDEAASSEDDEDDAINNDDNVDWLESMGVGQETLPQLQQSKINQEIKQLQNIDHHGSSVTLIQASHTQALFNYILNCRSLVSKTGHHIGIPPTLLSPVAFEGANLQSLSIKQGLIKQGRNLDQKYNLDISGPILPGNFSNLCKLFQVTQGKEFSASVKLLQATTPFNVIPNKPSFYATDGTKYFEQASSLNRSGLTNINYDKGFYSWETS